MMKKSEFEKFILRNLKDIESVNCSIVTGYDIDNNPCCWLDVFIAGVDEYTTIFTSENYEIGSKDIINLQKTWEKKLSGWINPNWDLPLVVDSFSV